MTVTAGPYVVVEQADSGYTTSYDNCDVTIANGGSATRTITNNDIAPKLTHTKHVVTDNGGVATASDWTLTATPNTDDSVVSGTGDPEDETGVYQRDIFTNTTYTLSESGSTGYSASNWTCEGTNDNRLRRYLEYYRLLLTQIPMSTVYHKASFSYTQNYQISPSRLLMDRVAR